MIACKCVYYMNSLQITKRIQPVGFVLAGNPTSYQLCFYILNAKSVHPRYKASTGFESVNSLDRIRFRKRINKSV